MSYFCSKCAFGSLKPIKSTLVRTWGLFTVTVPGFDAWRCDCCGYTRYDAAALAKLDLLLGSDASTLLEPRKNPPRPAEGPAEQGPRSWSP